MSKDFYFEVGRNIAQQRESLSLTQHELASSAGISRSSLANIELGRQSIALHVMVDICSQLECNISDLLPPKGISQVANKLPTDARSDQIDFIKRTLGL